MSRMPSSVFKMTKSSIIVLLLAVLYLDMITKAKSQGINNSTSNAVTNCNCMNGAIGECVNCNIRSCTNCRFNYFVGSFITTCINCPRGNCDARKRRSLDTEMVSKPVDCADVLNLGHRKNGIYEIWPMNRIAEGKSLNVFCDMDTDGGGWTVIQRRGDFQTPKDYFNKDWKNYKDGFGDTDKEFWLGNDNIFDLTSQKVYSARFDLKDIMGNKRYALYNVFFTDDENDKYRLHIYEYVGDAGDSMKYHNNQSFSTFDQDNDKDDEKSCAEIYKGAWWYTSCYDVNLNGLHHNRKHPFTYDGICWKAWKGSQGLLEWTEIKIRPKNFRATFS